MRNCIIRYVVMMVTLGVTFSGTAVQAEENDNEDNPNKQIVELQNALKSKEKDIEKLNKTIEELNKKLGKVNGKGQQKAQREDKALEEQVQALREDSLRLAGEVKRLTPFEQEAAELKSRCHDDSVSMAEMRIRLNKTENELESLNVFKTNYLEQMAASVEEKWLNKPYAQINSTEFKRDLDQYREYASSDKKIDEAYKKMQQLADNLTIYWQAKDAVEAPYDKRAIDNLLPRVNALKVLDKQTMDEIKYVKWQLEYYSSVVVIFQEIIGKVNVVLDKNRNSKSAAVWLLLDEHLKQMNNDKSLDYVNRIPWLSMQWKAYYDALKKNCLGDEPVKIAKQITDLKLD